MPQLLTLLRNPTPQLVPPVPLPGRPGIGGGVSGAGNPAHSGENPGLAGHTGVTGWPVPPQNTPAGRSIGYPHSTANRALYRAGYGADAARELVGDARHDALERNAAGVYHDPTASEQHFVRIPQGEPGFPGRTATPADPGYWGGFPGNVGPALQRIEDRGLARRARIASRQAARANTPKPR